MAVVVRGRARDGDVRVVLPQGDRGAFGLEVSVYRGRHGTRSEVHRVRVDGAEGQRAGSLGVEDLLDFHLHVGGELATTGDSPGGGERLSLDQAGRGKLAGHGRRLIDGQGAFHGGSRPGLADVHSRCRGLADVHLVPGDRVDVLLDLGGAVDGELAPAGDRAGRGQSRGFDFSRGRHLARDRSGLADGQGAVDAGGHACPGDVDRSGSGEADVDGVGGAHRVHLLVDVDVARYGELARGREIAASGSCAAGLPHIHRGRGCGPQIEGVAGRRVDILLDLEVALDVGRGGGVADLDSARGRADLDLAVRGCGRHCIAAGIEGQVAAVHGRVAAVSGRDDKVTARIVGPRLAILRLDERVVAGVGTVGAAEGEGGRTADGDRSPLHDKVLLDGRVFLDGQRVLERRRTPDGCMSKHGGGALDGKAALVHGRLADGAQVRGARTAHLNRGGIDSDGSRRCSNVDPGRALDLDGAGLDLGLPCRREVGLLGGHRDLLAAVDDDLVRARHCRVRRAEGETSGVVAVDVSLRESGLLHHDGAAAGACHVQLLLALSSGQASDRICADASAHANAIRFELDHVGPGGYADLVVFDMQPFEGQAVGVVGVVNILCHEFSGHHFSHGDPGRHERPVHGHALLDVHLA